MAEPSTPSIYPASGVYRPPLSVTVSGSLTPGDKLYYIIEESLRSQSPTVRKRVYTEPFLLTSCGRVRVTAFVWRPGFGEGQSISNIFMLDEDSIPSAPHPTKPVQIASPYFANAKVKKERKLVFCDVPHEIRSLEPFSVSVELVDEAGYQCSNGYDHPAKLLVAAESLGDTTTTQPVTVNCIAGSQSQKESPPPFVQTSNMLITHRATAHGNCSELGRCGKGGSWNAFADTTPCLSGSLTSFSVLSFKIQSLSRVIVGLHLGLEDVSSELAWRAIPFSFHFSADLNDPSTVPAFRIYESGKLVETAGTQEFSIGDEFSFRLRPNGDVSYFHEGDLIHTTSNSNPSSIFSVHARISSQMHDVAISHVCLVEDGAPFVASAGNLLWKPSTSTSQKDQKLILRAWIAGTDYVPAVAKIPVKTNALPRWAFAAISLASMFALGATGSQSGHVAERMSNHHGKYPNLSTIDDHARIVPAHRIEEKTFTMSSGN